MKKSVQLTKSDKDILNEMRLALADAREMFPDVDTSEWNQRGVDYILKLFSEGKIIDKEQWRRSIRNIKIMAKYKPLVDLLNAGREIQVQNQASALLEKMLKELFEGSFKEMTPRQMNQSAIEWYDRIYGSPKGEKPTSPLVNINIGQSTDPKTLINEIMNKFHTFRLITQENDGAVDAEILSGVNLGHEGVERESGERTSGKDESGGACETERPTRADGEDQGS